MNTSSRTFLGSMSFSRSNKMTLNRITTLLVLFMTLTAIRGDNSQNGPPMNKLSTRPPTMPTRPTPPVPTLAINKPAPVAAASSPNSAPAPQANMAPPLQSAPSPQSNPAPSPQSNPAPSPQSNSALANGAPAPQPNPALPPPVVPAQSSFQLNDGVPPPQSNPAPSPQTEPQALPARANPENKSNRAPEPQSNLAPEPKSNLAPEPGSNLAPEPRSNPAPTPQSNPPPQAPCSPEPVITRQPVIINQYCGSCEGGVQFRPAGEPQYGEPTYADYPTGEDYPGQKASGPGEPAMGASEQLEELDIKKKMGSLQEEMATLKSQLEELTAINKKEIKNADIKDCYDVYYAKDKKTEGIYEINPDGRVPFVAYCNFQKNPLGVTGNKWTVIMNRVDGTTSFNRTWSEYQAGFGSLGPRSNFWLGLEKMHRLTNQRQYSARIDITDWEGNTKHANYESFKIRSEAKKYSIFYAGYTGDAGDAMGGYHLDMNFSTMDEDNDNAEKENCAMIHGGGWWFNNCDHANLNGPYSHANLVLADQHIDTGMEWDDWKPLYSFKEARISLRPYFADQL